MNSGSQSAQLTEPFVHAPKQPRSRDTLERLERAALRLMEQKNFDRLSVSEITREAGVATGSFYTRFPDKTALLHALFRRYERERTETFERLIDPGLWVGASLEDRCRKLVEFFVEFARSRRAVLRSFVLHYRLHPEQTEGEFDKTLQRFYRRIGAVLFERSDEIAHPDAKLAVDFGLLMVAAVIRNKIVFQEDPHPRSVSISDRRLVRELTRALLGYLGADQALAGDRLHRATGKQKGQKKKRRKRP